MEPLEDYLLSVYNTSPENNRVIYDARERLMKIIKERETEDMRESLGGNRGIHLPNL